MADDFLFGTGTGGPKPRSTGDASPTSLFGSDNTPVEAGAAATPPPKSSKLVDFGEHNILANEADDGIVKSGLKLAGTALARGMMMPVGIYGDVRDFGRYLGDRAIAAVKGVPYETQAGISAEHRKQMPSSLDILPTTQELSDEFLRQLGTRPYVPTSTPEKIVSAALETAVGSRNPIGQGALRGAAPEMAARTAAKIAPVAGASAGVGTGVTEATGDPLAGVLAGGTVPALTGAAVALGDKYVPTVRRKSIQAAADRQLADLATDPDAIARGEIHDPLGVPTTTGATFGDKGLLQADKIMGGTDAQYHAARKDIEGKQNAVRVKTIEDLANPLAKPSDVADHFMQHLEQLQGYHDALVAQAERHAAQAATGVPDLQAVDAAGQRLQQVGRERMQQARTLRDRAYRAIDPNNELNVVAQDVGTAATKLRSEFDPAVSTPSPIAEPVIKMAEGIRQVMPFNSMVKFDTTVSSALAQAQRAGDNFGASQLMALQKAVRGSVRDALENQVKWEQAQVASGQMAQENTIGHRLAEEAKAFRDARRSAGTSVALTGTGPASGVRGAGGTEGPGGRSAIPAGGAPVAGEPRPNMDPDAAVRWTQARDAHRDFAQTFREGPVGDAIANVYGRFEMPGSQAAQRAFRPGDAGGEGVRAWARAVGGTPEGQTALADIAAARLREMMKGADTLTPEVLDAWKRRYGPALAELDNVVPGFSRRFDNAADATRMLGETAAARDNALSTYQQGIAKRFLGLEGGDDVRTAVGRIISGDNSAAATRQLMESVARNPEALQGVQKATVDWLLGRSSNAGILGGENILSGAKMPKLVRERGDALRQIFGDEGYENMLRVVDDLERQQAAASLAAEPGPDTAKKLTPLLKAIAEEGGHNQSWLTMMIIAGQEAIHGSGLMAKILAPIYVARGVTNKLRVRGIENVQDLVKDGLLYPEIGQAMIQRAMNADGTPNMAALTKLMTAINAVHGGTQLPPEEDEERQGRASGGAVSFDPSKHAAVLVRQATKIRKGHGSDTEKLLDLPDDHVAHALAIANEAMHG